MSADKFRPHNNTVLKNTDDAWTDECFERRCVYAWSVYACRSQPYEYPASLCLQLRVIRAFKSTLEDLEERRSVHSLHSLHSLRSSRSHTGPWPPRPLSDITYIDEDPTATKLATQTARNERDDYTGAGNRLLSPHTLKIPSHNLQFAPSASAPTNNSELLPKPVHETRI